MVTHIGLIIISIWRVRETPYKNMADQVVANKRYRKRKTEEKAASEQLTKDFEAALESIRNVIMENRLLRAELEQAIKAYYEVHVLARDPALPNDQKLYLIVNRLVPSFMLPYLNKLEKATNKMEEKTVE